MLLIIMILLDYYNFLMFTFRVMTPHPDFAPTHMSIQQALRKMHGMRYSTCMQK